MASQNDGFSPPVSSLELQRQREVCEHPVSAARAGQQSLSGPALQAVEQYVPRGMALPAPTPGEFATAKDVRRSPNTSLVFHRSIPS